MITYYGSQISPNKVETSEGFLICRNVPIARIGEQDYLARELQLDGDQDRIVKVNRYDADVFDKAALASFEGKPVTDGHPADGVGPENFNSLAKGHVQNVRREGDKMVADLYINDASLISDIQNGVKREVSCGYMCNYEEDGDGFKQTHIRGNHVAVVHSGRAGHDVAIKDAAAKAEERTHAMSKFSKAVLTAFGVAAKDAKDDEELKALTALAHDALDSDPAEEAPEEEPAKDESCEEEEAKDEAPDDLGAKLDKVIDMLTTLSKPTADEDPEEEEETLDDAIEELESEDEDPEEETEDEDPDEDTCDEDPEEASEVVEDEDPDEETEDEDEEEKKAADTAAFLRRMRPAVNAISNKDERARVTKALLSAVRAKDSSRAIFEASRKAAQKAADASGKTSYERRCEVQNDAYAKFNPHIKK